MNNLNHQRLVSIFILVLCGFLALTTVLIANQQRRLLYQDAYQRAVQFVDLMADASHEALLKSDFMTVRTFVARWGATHQDIHQISIVAPNGYPLAEYQNPAAAKTAGYSISKEIAVAGRPVATIHMSGDYRNALSIASTLQNRLFLSALVISILLGATLWLTFRGLALLPLEKMVQEQTQDLSAANRELLQEVSERKAAQAELIRREEHISLLLNSTAEGIYGVDLRGNCTFCNPAALRLLGYTDARDVVGRNIHKLIHHTRPDGSPYPARNCKVYCAFLKGEGTHVDDEQYWRADGTSFPVEYWAQPILLNHTPVGAVTAFTDITSRRRSENMLREQEEELSEIFANTPHLMVLLDEDGKIIRGNKVFCGHPVKPPPETDGPPVGMALSCIYALGQRTGCGFEPHCATCVIRNLILDTLKTGQNHSQREAKLRVRDSAGDKELTALVSTAQLSLREKHMVLLSLSDITEHKQLEAQLFHSQKMESVGTLASGIAHDFNNILSVIMGYGELTLMKMPETDPLRPHLEQILEASNWAAHLTRDLLMFSRKQPSDRKPVDLNRLVLKLTRLLERVIGENIAIRTLLSGDDLTLNADEYQLEQVLMNLVTNARDAMLSGGTLTISTKQVLLDEPLAQLQSIDRPGRYAVITITDTGRGMDQEECRHIFEPFYTTKDAGKGTGLGLAVVYGILTQHEGYIRVQSESGRGTSFMIYLPVTSFGEPHPGTVAKELPRGGTETILLAEDNGPVRNFTMTALREFGYNVIPARDGADAVAKYQEHKDSIELLLFDLVMPRKNGKEAYEVISTIQPDIKALFTSGYAPDTAGESAASGEKPEVIYKPVPPLELLQKVRSVLDGKRL